MIAERHRETILVGYLAAFFSLIAFLFFFQRDMVLLYGDAVAHINIARRVFDSRTPGLKQLGTVWLPLPHLLMIPFLISQWAWQNGLGGSLPSMIAYVAAVMGLFRLVRDGLLSFVGPVGASTSAPHIAAWFAAITFAANPNLLYMQATAMTESLYLACFIWAVVFMADFARQIQAGTFDRKAERSLHWCGLCLAAAMLTRYDGWFAGAIFSSVVLMLLAGAKFCGAAQIELKKLRVATIKFVLVVASVPIFWLAYNAFIYGNALEFATGPYSARAIEQRSTQAGQPPHPGHHNLRVATIYFIKSAEANLANGNGQKAWLLLAIAGTAIMLGRYRGLGAWLLLWIPLPFYSLSVAYGGVPIFMPVWWPFSYYNVRYGLQLLPAIVVFTSAALYFCMTHLADRRARLVVVLIAFGFAGSSYIFIWRAQPICLREAVANSRTRVPFERALAEQLERLPPSSTLIMSIGSSVGALQRAGIHLNRVIHEGNHGDPNQWGTEGMWKRALSAPERWADYAIGFDDDEVTRSARTHHLPALVVVETPGQGRATIYQTK